MTTKIRLNTAMFDKNQLSLGFFLFLFIIFLRSIVLILPRVHFFSLSSFEFYGIVSSYGLLLIIFFNFRNILWNRTNFIILVFISYSFISILWGSSIKEVSRIALPFMMIFLISFLITEKIQINYILKVIYLSFLLPVLLSFYFILTGKGEQYSDYVSGVERFGGAYLGTHMLAYSMLFFLFFVTLSLIHNNDFKRFFKIHIFAVIVISIFCLYKSSVRTAYVGLFVFIFFISLANIRKQKIFSLGLIFLLIAVVSSSHLQKIFWKTENDRDFNTASSGREEIWEHNLNVFKKMSFPKKIMGIGLGCEGKFIKEFYAKIMPSHNDYLSILMSLGILGLTIYVLLLISVLYDMFNSNIGHQIKLAFLGILISVMIMNFFSNAVIFRLELSQYFWIIVGLFYRLDHLTSEENYKSSFEKTLS